MKSQNDAILARLKRGPLTPMAALRELGCMRLAARIFELRLSGYTIERKTICGDGKHWAQYSLRA